MPVHIIIDGYNLLGQSGGYEDLQTSRERLIDKLAAYKRMKRHPITVVFDGTHSSPGSIRKENLKGINVRFSRHGELADSVIKRMAAKERERALIVSSDREIVDYAVSRGAAAISSSDFEQKLAMAAGGDDPDESLGGWIPTTKKKGPQRRLSKKERKRRTQIEKL